jgi:hypothetical protein
MLSQHKKDFFFLLFKIIYNFIIDSQYFFKKKLLSNKTLILIYLFNLTIIKIILAQFFLKKITK